MLISYEYIRTLVSHYVLLSYLPLPAKEKDRKVSVRLSSGQSVTLCNLILPLRLPLNSVMGIFRHVVFSTKSVSTMTET